MFRLPLAIGSAAFGGRRFRYVAILWAVRSWTSRRFNSAKCKHIVGKSVRCALPRRVQAAHDAAGVSNFAQTPLGPCAYSLSSEEHTMRINWQVVKPCLWTGAAGVVVGMWLLSYGFGFMGRTAAEKLAAAKSETAVIAALAPVCADKFRALSDVAARTATLVADKGNSFKMREAFPEALITLPGKTYPDSDLAAACAALVLAPPKTATLKP